MTTFMKHVVDEVVRARAKHPKRFNSQHEGIAIIREEYLELEHEIFHGDGIQTRNELIQLAAMCQRFAEDCL